MIHEAEKLLDDFRKLPGRVERSRTFIEIAGCHYYENTYSNIFAFFMDPEEAHGFGTLVLDALLSFEDGTEADKVIKGNVSVDREVVTNKGNKIDLLIASDDRAILIENKIHAAVNNPLDDYSDYLDHIADGRTKHKFLLTLDSTNEGSKWNFKNLTHEEFVEQIRSLLGCYVSNADTRHLTMFLDFLNTLENLQKGTRMDQEFVKFLAKQGDDVETLLFDVKSFRKEMRQKVRDLGTSIDVTEYGNVEQWFWKNEPHLYDCLVHDVSVSDELPIVVDTYVSPQEWMIGFKLRNGDRSRLKELLRTLQIPVEDGEEYSFYPTRFAYAESLDEIRTVLQELIDKLATSQKPEESR